MEAPQQQVVQVVDAQLDAQSLSALCAASGSYCRAFCARTSSAASVSDLENLVCRAFSGKSAWCPVQHLILHELLHDGRVVQRPLASPSRAA